MNRSIRRLFAILSLAYLLLFNLVITAPVDAASLYEASLTLLKSKVSTTSPDDFTFVVMGDSRDNDPVFHKTLNMIRKLQPLFVLHGGDVVSRGCKKEIDHFLETVKKSLPDLPIFVVVGNHEICPKDKSRDGGKKVFEAQVAPLNYVVDLKPLNTRVVVLDNADYTLNASQLAYLKMNLTPDRRHQFVAMHIPPATGRWLFHTFTKGAPELIQILAEKKVDAAFFSHLHLYDALQVRGVKYILTGGAGAPLTPLGFGYTGYHIVVVTVKNGQVTTRMVAVDE
jgi:3',5'-cyclic-AMP phosphodiesterase